MSTGGFCNDLEDTSATRQTGQGRRAMKLSIPKKSIIVVTILFVSACGSTQQPHSVEMKSTKCPELRPELCTMDYNPVCGNLPDGTFKTYSNGCNACSDQKVTSYSQGECK
jgi:hypothetical protein